MKAIHKMSYGVYIVSSLKNEKYNGQIVNSAFQVTSEPQSIAVCLSKKNLTHEFVSGSGLFSVSVLDIETPMIFIGKFGFKSGRDIDKFKDTRYKLGLTKAPIVLDFSIGCMEAEVTGSMDVGTHTLFIGKIVSDEVLNEKEPLTYEYYRSCLKGKSPETAPTYIKE